jgi:hypothetical protein
MKHSESGSPDKFSRESQAISPGLMNHKVPPLRDDSNTYDLSSKVSPDVNRGNNSSTLNQNNFNLSPDPPEAQLDSIEETSDKEHEFGLGKLKVNNPAFDSSPIVEDDEYDGIKYQPTP